MYKRLKAVQKYYNNLEYNKISKKEALKNICTLNRGIQLKNINPLDRFSLIINLLEDNLAIFQSACEHIDIVTNIIQVLNAMDAKITHVKNKLSDEEHIIHEYRFCYISIIILIFSTWKEHEVQLFVEDILSKEIKFIDCDLFCELENLKNFVDEGYNEMILLQDSDLYAVIDCLKTTRKFPLNKIWVQEQIKEKFLSLLEKNFPNFDVSIHIFQFKENLLITKPNHFNISITSIWSEDIIVAKNLAISLHKEIVYINTHMDFHSFIHAPQSEIFMKVMHDAFIYNICFETNFTFKAKPADKSVYNNTQNYPVYNPFYDGAWKPVNTTTFMISKDNIWARITFDDIKDCVDSANKGLEIWNTMSYNSRMQVLSNFVFTLECNGKSLLANIISRLIKNSSYLSKNNSAHYGMERFEITIQYKPRGIIFLKEENEITLFSRLIQILIAGNSVIVLCDANSFNLTPYCNMFATAEIPSGVINMLPSESLENLETFLFDNTYAEYIKYFFVKDRLNNLFEIFKTFKKLCTLKQIVVAIE